MAISFLVFPPSYSRWKWALSKRSNSSPTTCRWALATDRVRWAQQRVGSTGLTAVPGQSKDGRYARCPLLPCPKRRIWNTGLFYTPTGTMSCAPGNDQLANSAEPSAFNGKLRLHSHGLRNCGILNWHSNVKMSECWGLALNHSLSGWDTQEKDVRPVRCKSVNMQWAK